MAGDANKYDHDGLLVPPWFVREPIDVVDEDTSTVCFGFSLAVAVFAAILGGAQIMGSWRRRRRITHYMIMIWVEWVASIVLASLTWSCLRGYTPASFWVWFFMLLSWSLQVQMLLHIIINRLGLLVMVPGRIATLKWAVAAFITSINISVFCIWVPARLQISERYIRINNVWDRVEKGLFAVVDGGLSAYFIYLVRSELIKYGLTKYRKLYHFNLSMIFCSLSLDVTLIALMSLQNDLVYLQFHPVAYLLKLVIEVKMAVLIGRLAKASNAITGVRSLR
ncbi:hypothetical protein F5Y16DRAFT_410948 [Xylariaceae sp. FL0255]|nr:hypothetical protein F5Y16DRAFT_410948 [Xylariaceae sp. FL0255]